MSGTASVNFANVTHFLTFFSGVFYVLAMDLSCLGSTSPNLKMILQYQDASSYVTELISYQERSSLSENFNVRRIGTIV